MPIITTQYNLPLLSLSPPSSLLPLLPSLILHVVTATIPIFILFVAFLNYHVLANHCATSVSSRPAGWQASSAIHAITRLHVASSQIIAAQSHMTLKNGIFLCVNLRLLIPPCATAFKSLQEPSLLQSQPSSKQRRRSLTKFYPI